MGYNAVALKRVVMVPAAFPPLWRRMAIARGHDSGMWDTVLGIKLGFGLQAPVVLLDSGSPNFKEPYESIAFLTGHGRARLRVTGMGEQNVHDSLVPASKEESTQHARPSRLRCAPSDSPLS